MASPSELQALSSELGCPWAGYIILILWAMGVILWAMPSASDIRAPSSELCRHHLSSGHHPLSYAVTLWDTAPSSELCRHHLRYGHHPLRCRHHLSSGHHPLSYAITIWDTGIILWAMPSPSELWASSSELCRHHLRYGYHPLSYAVTIWDRASSFELKASSSVLQAAPNDVRIPWE